MDYLFDKWDGIKNELSNKKIFLFLDFDGTLTPIEKSPERAVLSKPMKALLARLSKKKSINISIISGRALKDVKAKVGLNNIVYVGNHGFEIEGPKIKYRVPTSIKYRKALKEIKANLGRNLSTIEGVILEDKGFSLSVHFRLVRKTLVAKVKTIVLKTVMAYAQKNTIAIRPGKMVLEIMPPFEWDKGKVALWLLARQKFLMKNKPIIPVYIGDDITDEDAFSALKNKGITIRVGKSAGSGAEFYLKNTGEVFQFLQKILRLKEET